MNSNPTALASVLETRVKKKTEEPRANMDNPGRSWWLLSAWQWLMGRWVPCSISVWTGEGRDVQNDTRAWAWVAGKAGFWGDR